MAHKINILVNPAAVSLCDRLNACRSAAARDRLLKKELVRPLGPGRLSWDDLIWAAAWGNMAAEPEGAAFVGYDECEAERYLLRLERELVDEYLSRQDE